MGTSTDGILYFGFDFHDGESCDVYTEGFNPDYWEDDYAKRIGIVDNSNFWTDEGEYNFKADDPEYLTARKEYGKFRNLKNDAIEEAGVILGMHCSYNYPIYYLALAERRASRGYSEDINLDEIEITEEDINKLKNFCEVMEIKYQEPTWRLASLWG